MRTIGFLFIMLASIGARGAAKREFYEIRVYSISSAEQQKLVDDYLQNAYLPAMHRAGITTIGVFKPLASDTAMFGKRIYVLTPFRSLEQFAATQTTLSKDKLYAVAGAAYLDAPYERPPYDRLETIVLQAFAMAPPLQKPGLSGPRDERVYELRSYESHTEKIYRNKIHMFNEGGEIALFKRLGFNAIFYGEVLAGARMPNLMYMTSFENRADRDAHWETFRSDAEWKKLSAMPAYQHNVSKINIFLLYPTAYSDL